MGCMAETGIQGRNGRAMSEAEQAAIYKGIACGQQAENIARSLGRPVRTIEAFAERNKLKFAPTAIQLSRVTTVPEEMIDKALSHVAFRLAEPEGSMSVGVANAAIAAVERAYKVKLMVAGRDPKLLEMKVHAIVSTAMRIVRMLPEDQQSTALEMFRAAEREAERLWAESETRTDVAS